MIIDDEKILEVSALLKAMAHPIRLRILCLLLDREMNVGDIRAQVKTTHANVSQHLTILRQQGIITTRREANVIFNQIADHRIAELLAAMRRLFC